ncbi:MAG: phytochelatin synthase family protein [Desulfobacterales bacterium]
MQRVGNEDAPLTGRFTILSLCLVCLWLALSAHAADSKGYPKYGPKEAPIAVPLSQSNDFFRNDENSAPDFWRLMPYYVPQITGGSCSVASVAMIVNGFARSGKALKDADTIIRQSDLLDSVKQHPWKKRRGLSLEKLNIVLSESLKIYGISKGDTQMVQTKEDTPKAFNAFRRVLETNEQSADDFLVVHYLQNVLTQAPGGPYPHISPIGAYDIKNRKVLILDVDRKWYEPYWVSDKVLFEAMVEKTRYFGHGGYIRAWVPLK